MTSEEMERAIEFLLQSQAKHDAQLGELAEQVNGLTQQVNGLTQQVNGLTQQVNALAGQTAETHRLLQLQIETQNDFMEIATRSIDALNTGLTRAHEKMAEMQARSDERQARNDERQARNDERFAELQARSNERFSETDARIDRIVELFERYVAGGPRRAPDEN